MSSGGSRLGWSCLILTPDFIYALLGEGFFDLRDRLLGIPFKFRFSDRELFKTVRVLIELEHADCGDNFIHRDADFSGQFFSAEIVKTEVVHSLDGYHGRARSSFRNQYYW